MSASPLIMIGMHRSGTSMVARMLEALGIFVGSDKESNHESMLFLETNEWLLRQGGGAWDVPGPIDHLLADTATRDLVVEYLRHFLGGPRSASYLGWCRYLSYRSVFRIDEPWAWKDPRSTFTLPIWLELFPTARVVYIERHGIDVASSLRRRQNKLREEARRRFRARRPVHAFVPKREGFTDSARCHHLEGGLSLWEEYVERGRAHVERLGERGLFVRYETFLAEPAAELKRIAGFCGLAPSSESIAEAAARVSPERGEAHKTDPELLSFASTVRERLQRYGYDA